MPQLWHRQLRVRRLPVLSINRKYQQQQPLPAKPAQQSLPPEQALPAKPAKQPLQARGRQHHLPRRLRGQRVRWFWRQQQRVQAHRRPRWNQGLDQQQQLQLRQRLVRRVLRQRVVQFHNKNPCKNVV